ncbi:hypothetical protein BpHYR1_034798, partial [Brachionus plicatilis]
FLLKSNQRLENYFNINFFYTIINQFSKISSFSKTIYLGYRINQRRDAKIKGALRFCLIPLGPSIRSLLLDVLEHVYMLLLNLNAHG